MRPSRQLDTVLFLQKPELLRAHSEVVSRAITDAFPGTRVVACGAASEVPSGACFDAVIAPTLPWLPEALARLGRYDWVHFLSAGVEKIWDMPFRKDDVLLTKSSGIHGVAMAEFALGAMLYFAKSFDRFVEQARQGVWQRTWLDELAGRTVVILGMGHIGSEVARCATNFGMNVIGVQRTSRDEADSATLVSVQRLGEVLPGANYLVVCLPLTPETKNLVSENVLRRLPRGATLVDISRGGVVSESAVLHMLQSGHLRGAALDVFEQEPLPAESGLWRHPKVLLTPHVSGTNPHYMERAMDVFIANARRVTAGDAPLTPVDTERRY